jgi:DNA-binding transcriptional regulator YiaG
MTKQAKRKLSAKAKKKNQITIGEMIKLARKKLNKRAEDIAAQCNVTRECVFQWERRAYIIE